MNHNEERKGIILKSYVPVPVMPLAWKGGVRCERFFVLGNKRGSCKMNILFTKFEYEGSVGRAFAT